MTASIPKLLYSNVCLQGQINNERKQWIRAAYDKLDVTKDGRVTL